VPLISTRACGVCFGLFVVTARLAVVRPIGQSDFDRSNLSLLSCI